MDRLFGGIMTQSAPHPNDERGVQSQVADDMLDRMVKGIESYGTVLQPFNGRDALQDLYEELLDACNYVKQAMLERDSVVEEVQAEMRRQQVLWGEQNHPNVDPHANYGFPTADIARTMCEDAFSVGKGTWAHIFAEEVCEALDTDNTKDLREELVQVAAVTASWIKSIDRNS
jgi:hypothetical protein